MRSLDILMLVGQDNPLIDVLHYDIVFKSELIWCFAIVRDSVVARSSAEASLG